MNVGEIMEKIDVIESITDNLLDVREAVTVDEDMAAAAERAIGFLDEYAEALKELKIQK